MKNKFFLSLALVVSLGAVIVFASFKQVSHDEGYVMVDTHEAYNVIYGKSSIVVSDGKTILKTEELENLKSGLAANAIKINSILNELKNQGYRLVSSNGSGMEGAIKRNYIFEKSL